MFRTKNNLAIFEGREPYHKKTRSPNAFPGLCLRVGAWLQSTPVMPSKHDKLGVPAKIKQVGAGLPAMALVRSMDW